MSNPYERISATLAQLQAELGELDEVDPEAKRQLSETLDELQKRLERPPGSQAARPASAPRSSSLAGRLHEAALRFEESHPTFSTSLGTLAGVLGQMGF